ncbi:MAG TPA: hypothetical protein VHI93_02070, partial [Candidatus Thermoplasmatota archaeon]|nr:hypothetical protein [Candidatus Thermoplasmatota archaeon]
MESVTVWRGAAYRHRQPRLGPVACPTCGTGRVAFRQWCRRLVEYPGPEQPAYLVLRCPSTPARTLPASAGTSPRRSPRRPPAPALQRTATRQYCCGTAALQAVWPHAERQLCWFLVMHWLTHTLARLLRDYCETLPEAERQDLTRLRFRLLACPDWQMRLGERERAALARAWELVRG